MARKTQITIQISPLLKSQIWQYAKDEGIPYQVGCEYFMQKGMDLHLKEVQDERDSRSS